MGEGDNSTVTQSTCQSYGINLDGTQVCTGLERNVSPLPSPTCWIETVTLCSRHWAESMMSSNPKVNTIISPSLQMWKLRPGEVR